MSSLVTCANSCIVIHAGNNKISVDPTRPVPSDFVFFSHAHIDHLCRNYSRTPSTIGSKILTSKETSLLAHARGFPMNEINEEYHGFQLLDTGHILGSKGLLIGDNLYYTGDISSRKRAFMKSARIPEVHTLIIETTFGRPQYIFPDLTDVIHKTNKIISEMYDQGIPVLLMGYPLGKAQILTALFGHWEPFYIHDSVHKMNSTYKKLGIGLKDATIYSEAENQGLLSRTKPWVMIAPLMHSRSTFVKLMKQKYSAVSVGFSGWAIDKRYRVIMGLDYAVAMSDHCDYAELLEFVKVSGAKKIYTFHGFSQDFADSLSRLGFDAAPVLRKGTTKKEARDNKATRHPSLDEYL
ncbi:MAG TPA: MBL fold metallo-hydrolase [Candidatus Nitrosopolaris sp.]|nr:MBL fold metallo-hydrolase [Candidatus Nitrosopolaris sp.]